MSSRLVCRYRCRHSFNFPLLPCDARRSKNSNWKFLLRSSYRPAGLRYDCALFFQGITNSEESRARFWFHSHLTYVLKFHFSEYASIIRLSPPVCVTARLSTAAGKYPALESQPSHPDTRSERVQRFGWLLRVGWTPWEPRVQGQGAIRQNGWAFLEARVYRTYTSCRLALGTGCAPSLMVKRYVRCMRGPPHPSGRKQRSPSPLLSRTFPLLLYSSRDHSGLSGPRDYSSPPAFPRVGIVPVDVAGRWVFSGFSRFPRPFHSGAAPYSPRLTLIGSQEHKMDSKFSLGTRTSVMLERSPHSMLVGVLFRIDDLLTNSQCEKRVEDLLWRDGGANPRPSDYKLATLLLSYGAKSIVLNILCSAAECTGLLSVQKSAQACAPSQSSPVALQFRAMRVERTSYGGQSVRATPAIASSRMSVGWRRARLRAQKFGDWRAGSALATVPSFPDKDLHVRRFTDCWRNAAPAVRPLTRRWEHNILTEHIVVHFPNRSRGGIVVRILASHLGKPGSIPGGVASGFSHVGIVPDDVAGRRVFSVTSPPPPLHSRAAPYSPRFTLIDSPHLDIRNAQISSLTHFPNRSLIARAICRGERAATRGQSPGRSSLELDRGASICRSISAFSVGVSPPRALLAGVTSLSRDVHRVLLAHAAREQSVCPSGCPAFLIAYTTGEHRFSSPKSGPQLTSVQLLSSELRLLEDDSAGALITIARGFRKVGNNREWIIIGVFPTFCWPAASFCWRVRIEFYGIRGHVTSMVAACVPLMGSAGE
ncbi:hypothetical protein PR048_015041 [Dryococelus australis]|uniref:Uncharacterized protein n=1 Tax=Dryococelus australis TaxID=614101 RepID=A0ABQ9HFW4_9NEOP|nr:hypothetical protein PR048_015041 [Dryococelus australis]